MTQPTRWNSFRNSLGDIRIFVLKHKALSLVVMTVLVVFAVSASFANTNQGIRPEKRENLIEKRLEGYKEKKAEYMKKQEEQREMKGFWNPDRVGKGMGQEVPPQERKNRMYERFCLSGGMNNPEWFKDGFGPWAEKRGEDMINIHQQVEKLVYKLSKEGYDVSNIKNQLEEIKNIKEEFKGWVEKFEKTPESFCEQHTGWLQLNEKIKSIMTGILQEIESIEQ